MSDAGKPPIVTPKATIDSCYQKSAEAFAAVKESTAKEMMRLYPQNFAEDAPPKGVEMLYDGMGSLAANIGTLAYQECKGTTPLATTPSHSTGSTTPAKYK